MKISPFFFLPPFRVFRVFRGCPFFRAAAGFAAFEGWNGAFHASSGAFDAWNGAFDASSVDFDAWNGTFDVSNEAFDA